MTQCALMGGVRSLEVTNVCDQDYNSVSPYCRCSLSGGYNLVFVTRLQEKG